MLLDAIETISLEKSGEVDVAGMKTVIVEISLWAGMSGKVNPLAIMDNELILSPVKLWACILTKVVGYEPSIPSIHIELHSAYAVHCNRKSLVAVAAGSSAKWMAHGCLVHCLEWVSSRRMVKANILE
ncbi:hypothetical protein F5141DRAFT_1065495 [Pisolithus sp. B1]|nr:hypothetical protein F5141DRAFT_1065495 [Pisolithus sp. B1]